MQVISRHMTRVWRSIDAHVCTGHAPHKCEAYISPVGMDTGPAS